MQLPPSDLQRLLAEEPFVRALARSLVADEADDVVQQAWVRALEQRRETVRDLRSWLARLVRNLAIDLQRRRKRRGAREDAAAPPSLVPSSADLVEAEERRRELVAAVDALPEHLRTVVLLRWFEGLPPRRIAKALGVPSRVVWNRLHAALVALRESMDAGHGGDRRAWLVPLVPFAVSPRALPWSEMTAPSVMVPVTTGVIAMGSKLKVVGVVTVVAALAVTWGMWPPGEASVAPPNGPSTPAAPVVAALEAPKVGVATEPPAGAARESVAAAVIATTGDLEVVVQYADEPKPASDVWIEVLPVGGDIRVDGRRAVTDGEGRVRFEGLSPGAHRIDASGRSGGFGKANVEVGKLAKCELQLRRGFRLDGVVVDGSGAPVGGALIESAGGGLGEEARTVARTAADGTFVLRECRQYALVSARATGFAASKLHFVRGDDAPTAHLRIELSVQGGAVEGVVVDAAGKAIVGAVVRVGTGQTDGIRSTDQGAPPLPAQVRCDEAGRFLAIGVPSGTQPIMVRAASMSPWRSTVEVMPGVTSAVRATMTPGVTCRGVVRDEAGQPVADATVSVGGVGEFTRFEVASAADGAFVLQGLPAGDVEVAATKDKVGKASARVSGEPGTEVRSDLVLSAGLTLRGRVVDEAGAPLRGVDVRCVAEGPGGRWGGSGFSDAQGRFAVTECPPGRTLNVSAALADRVAWQRTGVDPRAGAHDVTLPKDTSLRARIVGRLLLPDGLGAIGAEVRALRSPQVNSGAKVSDASGAFMIEVAQGAWDVSVRVKGFPQIRREARQLAPGETWDVGSLQLTPGGTLVVQDDPATKVDYLVLDAEDHFVCGLYSPVPPLRSELLAPGDYWLLVRGKGVAAHVRPFTIRAGEETRLEVKTEAGVTVQFEFVPPAGETPRSVYFSLRRDGRLVAFGNTGSGAAGLVAEACVAPGDYEFVTRERPQVTTMTLTVREGMLQPIRVVLR